MTASKACDSGIDSTSRANLGPARAPPRPVRSDGTAARLRRWRARRRVSPAWTVAVAAIIALVLLPVLTIAVLASAPTGGMWRHLATTVLPRALIETAVLTAGVGALALVAGTTTAWLVTVYRFPGRDLVSWLLLLPLAVPTYVVAYCYADLLDYSGPVQGLVRALSGAKSRADYWFPDVRSLPGAVLVLASVLYPYVYLTARASFLRQSVGTLEVARTLGCSMTGAFFQVALPLARPALAAGVALVAMECLNDIGAVQHLGVETLSRTVYATYTQRSSLGGAAQIALVMLAAVVVLFGLEHRTRGARGFADTSGNFRAMPELDLGPVRGALALAACALPPIAGFALPLGSLVGSALAYGDELAELAFWRAAGSSLLLSAGGALLATGLAVVLVYGRRVAPNGLTRPAVRVAGFGYAIPGTVLALGLLFPLAGLDNGVDAFLRRTIGVSTGLVLSGSALAVLIAYAIRFIAVSAGAVETGLQRISLSLDHAARTLGETSATTLRRVHFPLLKPTLGAAFLLVFVDGMKELPATMLLRPPWLNTLATRVYEAAALEAFEVAAFGALMIVLVGMLPVVLLNRTIRRR